MNYHNFRAIMRRGQKIGLVTIQDLADFKKRVGAKSNTELLSAVNAEHCRELYERSVKHE